MKNGQSSWGWLTVLLLLALLACGYLTAHRTVVGESIRPEWVAVTATLVALCALAGYLVNSRFDGILIDDRNRVSLSRLQWVAWFVVLISGYFTESIANVVIHWGATAPPTDPFPTIAPELLGLIGIASASPVASSMIVVNKKQASPGLDAQDAQNAQAAQTARAAQAALGPQAAQNAQPAQDPQAAEDAQAAQDPQAVPAPPAIQPMASDDAPTRQGAMDANKTTDEASWADLYLGEEVANRYVVDISRLQNLVFTVLLIGVYLGGLWVKLAEVPKEGFASLPEVGQSFVWLLGVSHAAYLTSKAAPKSPPR
ncbi:MAG: hypothetical protein ABSG83_04005 [Roseiarcus sp.]